MASVTIARILAISSGVASLRCDAASPITAVHLWFDRPVVDLPHAVLVGRTSQWVFRGDDATPGYCQVVISASRHAAGRPAQETIDAVVAELAESIGARPVRLPGGGKSAYHAAAMMAAGGLVGLLDGIVAVALVSTVILAWLVRGLPTLRESSPSI